GGPAGGAQETPQRGGVLSGGFSSDSKTIDPTYSVEVTQRQVLYVVYKTLVRHGAHFSHQPELAEKWKIENDGRNPNYWEAGKPYLDRIIFRDIAGSIVGIQRLSTGELDFVGDLSPQEIRPLQSRPNIKLHPITVGRWYSLQWHMYEPP